MPPGGPTSEVVLGIDLGTTNSVVAVLLDGDAEVLQNDIGNRLTPSCVYVSGDINSTVKDTVVGEAALRLSVIHPQSTIRSEFLMGETDDLTTYPWNPTYTCDTHVLMHASNPSRIRLKA